MLNMIILSFRVRFTIISNRVAFLFRRLPLIGKAMPQSIYRESELKIVVAIIGALLVFATRLMKHLMYIAILAFVGIVLSQAEAFGGFMEFLRSTESFAGMSLRNAAMYGLTVWFILSYIGAPLTSMTISGSNHKNNNIMVNYMRADPAVYAKSRIFLDRVGDVFLFLPLLLLVFWGARLPIYGAFVAMVIFTSFRLSGEALNMWMHKKFGKHFGDTPLSYIATAPVYIAGFVAPYFTGPLNLAAFFQNPFLVVPITLVCTCMGFLALRYIKNYPLYMNLIRDILYKYEVLYQKSAEAVAGGATLAVAKDWGKDISSEQLELDRHQSKTGFAYLNSIFFERHSKFFAKKMRRRYMIILAPLAVALLVSIYSLFGGEPLYVLLQNNGWFDALDTQARLFEYTPMFFFILSIASMGRIVSLAVFSNCDVHMLHYPYYRTAKTILASFRSRLAAILRYNLIITVLIFVSVIGTIALIFGYVDIHSAVFFFLALICMGAFFAFSDLFLYYVIQPYDSGGKDKSFLHKAINYVIAWAAGFMIFGGIGIDLVHFTIAMVIISVLYLGIGMLLLYALAPKRFKLR